MPLHTTPSGNGYPLGRRHLTSANAGAFIHQSAASVLPRAPVAPGDCHLQHVVRGANLQSVGGDYSHVVSAYAGTASDENPAPIHENAGRDFGNPNSAFYLSYPCWPTTSRAAAWQAGPYANPSQAHAAPAIHGATL